MYQTSPICKNHANIPKYIIESLYVISHTQFVMSTIQVCLQYELCTVYLILRLSSRQTLYIEFNTKRDCCWVCRQSSYIILHTKRVYVTIIVHNIPYKKSLTYKQRGGAKLTYKVCIVLRMCPRICSPPLQAFYIPACTLSILPFILNTENYTLIFFSIFF